MRRSSCDDLIECPAPRVRSASMAHIWQLSHASARSWRVAGVHNACPVAGSCHSVSELSCSCNSTSQRNVQCSIITAQQVAQGFTASMPSQISFALVEHVCAAPPCAPRLLSSASRRHTSGRAQQTLLAAVAADAHLQCHAAEVDPLPRQGALTHALRLSP